MSWVKLKCLPLYILIHIKKREKGKEIESLDHKVSLLIPFESRQLRTTIG